MSDAKKGLLEGDDENWPANGYMEAVNAGPEYKRPPNWKIFANQLTYVHERYKAGNPLALFDALSLCRRGNLPLPEWLFEGFMQFGGMALRDEFPKKRGKIGSMFSEIRNTLVHHERHVAVYTKYLQLQEIKSGDPYRAKIARLMLGLKPDEKIKATWKTAYERAAVELKGSFAQGEPRAMEDSYRLVEKWHSSGDARALKPPRALSETCKMLGLRAPRMGSE